MHFNKMSNIVHALKYVINTSGDYNRSERQREVITHLKFIGTILPGEKLDTKNLKIESNNFFTPFKRMIFGDSRDSSYNFMCGTIERSFEIIYSYCQSERKSEQLFCINIINDLIKAVLGLKNMQKTYKDDKMFVCNIETLVENIEAKLTELKEKYPVLFTDDSLSKLASEVLQQQPILHVPVPEVSNNKSKVSNTSSNK